MKLNLKIKNLFVCTLTVLSLFLSLRLCADDGDSVYIKVGSAKLKKSLIALPPLHFLGSPSKVSLSQSVGSEIFNTIWNDFEVTGYFQFIKQDAFLEDTAKTGLRPESQEPKGFKFDSWKQIGAEFLVRAGFSIINKELELEIYLYHISTQKLILGKKYKGPTSALRKIAHTFTNDAMEKLTGTRGMFNSKLVVSSDVGTGKYKEILVMDWDGYNAKKVSHHKSIAVSPSWSPEGDSILYTAFVYHTKTKKRNADLFSFELKSEKRWMLSSRSGINSGAVYTSDGKHILLTVSQGGNPDIYQMTNDGDSLKKLTNGPAGAMNVEPASSPDGSKIAFSSDRSGQPMIYVMNSDGSNVKRLTFAGKYNSSPSWSPDGKKLAFAGYDKSHFDIFVMNNDGSSLERLTTARKVNGKMADNEDPSFSPDGRHIVFTSNRTMNQQIYIIGVDGNNERRVTTDRANYYRPKWSNNIE